MGREGRGREKGTEKKRARVEREEEKKRRVEKSVRDEGDVGGMCF